MLLREVRFDWHHKALPALRVRARPEAVVAAVDAFDGRLLEGIAASEVASAAGAAAWRRRMHGEVCPGIVAMMARRAMSGAAQEAEAGTGAGACPPAYATVLR